MAGGRETLASVQDFSPENTFVDPVSAVVTRGGTYVDTLAVSGSVAELRTLSEAVHVVTEAVHTEIGGGGVSVAHELAEDLVDLAAEASLETKFKALAIPEPDFDEALAAAGLAVPYDVTEAESSPRLDALVEDEPAARIPLPEGNVIDTTESASEPGPASEVVDVTGNAALEDEKPEAPEIFAADAQERSRQVGEFVALSLVDVEGVFDEDDKAATDEPLSEYEVASDLEPRTLSEVTNDALLELTEETSRRLIAAFSAIGELGMRTTEVDRAIGSELFTELQGVEIEPEPVALSALAARQDQQEDTESLYAR